MDNRVAAIVLDAVQNRLPNYGIVDEDGEVAMGRAAQPVRARNVQLLPSLLFTIDWAWSAPGISWPETYFVTFVPSVNLRIVTASKADTEIWGFSDLAIGFCRAVRTPDFGVKSIIQSWWRRASGNPSEREPWQLFESAGLIDEARATAWRDEVYGKGRRKLD